MSDQLLTFLKYIFLALLYLFFLRVLRAVWMELREPKPAGATPSAPAAAPAPSRRSRSRSRSRSSPDAERLVILEPPDRQGQEFALGEELTVGRAGGCGVMIPDDTFVSQLHARVFRRDGDLYVEDLGSTNGTYLNNKKITTAVAMRKGDKLKIGKTTMEVRR